MWKLVRSGGGLLLVLLACAPARTRAPQPPAPISAAHASALVELMRYEDTRSFDDTAFARLAAAPAAVVRGRTMLAAGRVGNRAALTLLVRGLGDPDGSVRAQAAFALGELGDSSAQVVDALGALSRTDAEAAVEAVAALGKIGGGRARGFVEAVLRTRKNRPEVREALLAIWRFPRQPATTALLRSFTTSSDAESRWRAVYALTRGPADPAIVERLRELLRADDPVVRSFAARGLRAATADSAQQRAAAAAALLAALHDADAHVRINALNALSGYRDAAHAGAVAPLLTDPDLNTRIAAAQALGIIKGPQAAAALEARARDAGERATIRGSALVALVAADAQRGLALASELATSDDWLMRMYTARALANAHDAGAFELARRLASAPDYRIAAPAVAAAAAIAGDTLSAARALFIEKLAAADPYVRAEALAGLERLAAAGDEAIVLEAFGRATRDTIEDAGVAAISVLAKLAEKNPAVQRAFAIRFPIERIRLQEVRRAAARQLKLPDACCTLSPRPDVYERVVRELLVPALRGAALPRVRFHGVGGAFDVELLSADAPLTVANFLALVRRGYYNGSRWHRVVPNFVLQDGDPTGTGNGGPGYAIRDEINRVRYGRGAVGMALSGPDTGGSQFFVTHSPQPHLDGGYTVFGRVVAGMDVADRVIQDDMITSIEVIQ